MKNWIQTLKSKELTYILLGVITVLLVLAAYLNFDNMAIALYDRDGKNPKAKGELLTTYLSVIGGCAVIYGLYLNNKRLNEQTRQNDIAKTQADIVVSNNNDKRFGDAIGYLNSHNVGVAVGGAYSLYQLAKEDKRYTAIVGNIYSEYLSNVNINKDNRIYSLVSQLVFREIFNDVNLKFIGLEFKNESIGDIVNKTFLDCSITNLKVDKVAKCIFDNCRLSKFYSSNMNSVTFSETIIDNSGSYSIHNVFLEHSIVDCCEFGEIWKDTMYGLVLIHNKSIKDTKIISRTKIDNLVISNNIIEGEIEIKSPTIENSNIDSNPFIIIVTNSISDDSINGDKSMMKIMAKNEYKDLKNKEEIQK